MNESTKCRMIGVAGLALVLLQMNLYGAEDATESASPVTPINESAALTFYLPFEGTMQATYARGLNVPFMSAYADRYVDGILGKAAYFGREPGPQPERGWMQYPVGRVFGDILDVPRERGTIELWFRPHREMLTYPTFRKFYLWSVVRRGPEIFLEPKKDGSLTLNLSQELLSFTFPAAERVSQIDQASYDLPTNATFFGTWHHLAFVYDGTIHDIKRQVYLDGKRVIDMPVSFEQLEQGEQPCISGQYFNIGGKGMHEPYTACCDLDELKIYDGVRYVADFKPERPTQPAVRLLEATLTHRLADIPDLVSDGKFQLEANRIILPLAAGGETFELGVQIGDGFPLIISSKGIKLGLKDMVEQDPPIEPLSLSAVETMAPGKIGFKIDHYNIDATLSVIKENDHLRMTLSLSHNGAFWRAPLEVRASIRKTDGTAWRGLFDGRCDRALTDPFMPSYAEGLAGIFPVVGAWGQGVGVAVAFDPKTILSYFRQGVDSVDAFSSAWRPVLDPGQHCETAIDLYTFDPRYSGGDAVARYHKRYPEIFQPDPQVAPNIYKATAQFVASTTFRMRSTHKPEKSATFSTQELCRRANVGWEWYYQTGASAGDWNFEPFFQQALPEYKGKFGGANSVTQKNYRLNNLKSQAAMGISPGFYINTWMERRYARYFSGSLIRPFDSLPAAPFLNNWWTSGMRDYVFMPSWSRAGDLMRKEIGEIVQENPPVELFCYDVAEGDHRDRVERPEAGSARSFDKDGVFNAHLAAMGQLCGFIRTQKTASGKTVGIIGNPHIDNVDFSTAFKMDSFIWEGNFVEIPSNENYLRAVNRFLGAKSHCFFTGYNIDNTEVYYPEAARKDPEKVRLDMIAERMQCFLRSLVNNSWLTPDMVYGIKEIAEGQQDLARTLECGFNIVPAAEVTKPLEVARYGNAARGVYAIVNPSFEPQSTSLSIDSDYLKAVPILARAAQTSFMSQVNSRELTVESLKLKGLDYMLLDAVASLTGLSEKASVSIDAGLSRSPSERIVRIGMNAATPEKATLCVGLESHEVVVQARLNGQDLEMTADKDGHSVSADLALDGKAELVFAVKANNWISPASEVIDFPFISQTGESARILYADEDALNEAKRVSEYFSFWTRNTEGWKPVRIKLEAGIAKDAGKDQPLVGLSLKAPEGQTAREGILRDGDVLQVWAPDSERLREMTDIVLSALDARYPYIGYCGNHRVVNNYEDSRSQALLEYVDLPGKSFSVQESLRDYIPDPPHLLP